MDAPGPGAGTAPGMPEPTSTPVSARRGDPRAPVRIGVSQCLLGENVRFDGGHKRDPFLTGTLARHVEFVPVCPEVELGMGIPREPVRLEGRVEAPRMVGVRTGADHTEAMNAFARRRARALDAQDLCGYILKKGSPSCGMERVEVHRREGGPPGRHGTGLFARALLDHAPLLPVEEEGRLRDPVLRENFVERIFAYRRWKDFLAVRWSVGRLAAFHTAHKFFFLSHSPVHYSGLGRITARARELGAGPARERYGRLFMAAAARPATASRHASVLRQLAGLLGKEIDAAARAELAEAIGAYRSGRLPLVVPVTLIRHHARAANVECLLGQVYLEPHPGELLLRNHV